MRVFVESTLNCPARLAWAEVQKSALLLEVIRPLARLEPVDEPFPQRWSEGTTLRCRTYLFGFIPLGIRTLTFERIDQVAREIQTRESDPLIRTWDHVIRIRETNDGRTIYSDEIELDAGVLTPLAWVFTQYFYGHRQNRWRAVASRLTAT